MKPRLKACLLVCLLICAALVWMARRVAANDISAEAAAAIDSRIAGKPPGDESVNFFGASDFERGAGFVWSKRIWCEDLIVYLTCFSPWNSRQKTYQGGTLITPRHAIFAEHFSGASGNTPLKAGDKLAFVGKTNINYMRTLKAGPVRVGSSDICVGTFVEGDLPPDVVPAQVLPAKLTDRFLPAGTPVIFLNKNKQAHVAELVSLTGVVIRPATDPKRVPWTLGGPAYVGDSGSPIFAMVNGQLVLLAMFQSPVSGLPVCDYVEGINALLGRGYKVDVAKVGN